MAATVSVIVPMRNLEQEIAGLLRLAAGQAGEFDAEFVVVDMGSTDCSVLAALNALKEQQLKGYVMQSGQNGKIGAVCNSAMYRISGDYFTFWVPWRLFDGYLAGCCQVAQETAADVVFGVFEDQWQVGIKAKKIRGEDVLANMIKGVTTIDVGAVLIKRAYLEKCQFHFEEHDTFGVGEEFVQRALLGTDDVYQAPVVVKRNKVYQVNPPDMSKSSAACLQRVDAACRVFETVRYQHADNQKLTELYAQEWLPAVVLDCVDTLLRSGVGYNAVRGMLKVKGCDKLLSVGKYTSLPLKKRILVWKMMPWMYHPAAR